MKAKNFIGNKIVFIIAFTIVVFSNGCRKNEVKESEGDNKTVDAITASTPNGEKLKAAQEGPERSVSGVPSIDLASFRLEITGMVDSAYNLTWKEIQTIPPTFTDTMLMFCVEGWEVWGQWKGLLIKDLLESAKLKQDAAYVFFKGVDGYTTTLPIQYLINYNAILAYEVNGSTIRQNDGFPLRLIAFGKFGYKWAKWVTKMERISHTQAGYWESNGYPDLANVPLVRRKFYEGDDAELLSY